MGATDQLSARAQWLAQMAVIRRNERRMAKALAAAYNAGLERWQASGAVVLPLEAQRDVAANLTRLWREAVDTGARFVVDMDKGAFPALERKEEEQTLFEQIMLEFIQRFGAEQVRLILETTRDQIVRAIDRGVRDGLGTEAIARLVQEAVPQFSRTRARVIARTETHNAAMFASQEVAKASPFPMNKRWISVYDHRTRDFGEGDGVADQFSHRAMNEVTVGPDEMFSVPKLGGGFELMTGPGDPNGSAANIIGCRCALIYRRVGRPWPKASEA